MRPRLQTMRFLALRCPRQRPLFLALFALLVTVVVTVMVVVVVVVVALLFAPLFSQSASLNMKSSVKRLTLLTVGWRPQRYHSVHHL